MKFVQLLATVVVVESVFGALSRVHRVLAGLEVGPPSRRQDPAPDRVLYALAEAGCLRGDGVDGEVAAVAAAIALPEGDEDEGQEEEEESGDGRGQDDVREEGGGRAHLVRLGVFRGRRCWMRNIRFVCS